jgi:hypothetical protein
VVIRQLAVGYRCTCHHSGRRCKYQCTNSTEVIRPSDDRPVCGSCVRCNPEDSAGFRVDDHHWAEAS